MECFLLKAQARETKCAKSLLFFCHSKLIARLPYARQEENIQEKM
jgi:hypothetical protein